METEFRNTGGERVGYIIGNDVKDSYGNRVGYINGNEIRDSSGNRAGLYDGNDIKDNYGNRLGYINGNEIRDIYGNKVGYPLTNASKIEIIAAALLLFKLEPTSASRGTSHSSSSESDGGGWIAIAAMILIGVFAVIKKIFFLFIQHFSDGAFDFNGRSTRKEWWVKCLLGLLVIFLSFLILGGILFGIFPRLPVVIQLIILSAGILLVMVPMVAISVRRMHDMGKRGWWILVPVYGFILCGFFPGKVEENPY